MLKKTIFLAVFLSSFELLAQKKDTHLLQNIQQKLTWQSTKDSLLFYSKAMDKMITNKPNPYVNYWDAYAKYLLYFEFDQVNEDEKKKAEQTVGEGVQLIENIQNKTKVYF